MKVLDPGHCYELEVYDGDSVQTLRFMKREGPIYPGNVGHHDGTNIQEVLRVLIDRLEYLNHQIPSKYNNTAILQLQYALLNLERRAAERHGLDFDFPVEAIEKNSTCTICGHIICRHMV